MKYRIVYYIESRDFGGAEQMLFNLLMALDRDLWEPVLVYHPHPGIIPFVERIEGSGIKTLSVPLIKGLGDISGMKNLIQNLKELRPAVFHAQLVSNLRCTCGITCARLAGVKAILATQHLYQEIRPRRIFRIYTLVLYQKLISMLVDYYIAVSYKQAERLKKNVISENKVKVVQNAVNVQDFCHKTDANLLKYELKHNEDKRVVLTVARMDKLKGHKYLIEAAPLVPDAIFLLAGDGPERAKMEERARELGVADRVVFLGSRNDIPELLSACDVFILPSILEGLPLSILEAMSASKPVIATDIGGTNEIIIDGENGLLVPPGDSKALAEKIKLLLSDKSLAKRLAVSGKERVLREFSTEIMIERITNIYRDVIERKKITGN